MEMVVGLKIRDDPRLFGHQAGARRVREIVESCPDLGIKYLTIFAFSTENWKRTQLEVSGLMKLFKRYIYKETQPLIEAGFVFDLLAIDLRLEACFS